MQQCQTSMRTSFGLCGNYKIKIFFDIFIIGIDCAFPNLDICVLLELNISASLFNLILVRERGKESA